MSLCACGCGKELPINARHKFYDKAPIFILGHWAKTAAGKQILKNNLDHTGETRSEAWCNNISKALTGKRLSEVTKAKQSARKLGVPQLPEHVLQRANSNKGKHRTQEMRKRMSIAATESWHNVEFPRENKGGRGITGYYFSQKNNCNIFYQSKGGELAAYIKLENDPSVLQYGRVKFTIPYIIDGEAHIYHPDIMVEYIDGIKKIIEVKMSWEFKHPARSRCVVAKLLALQAYCENNGLASAVWTEKDMLKTDAGIDDTEVKDIGKMLGIFGMKK